VHLLSAKAAPNDVGDDAVDLDQSPAELVILSAAESELSGLAAAHARRGAAARPTLRLANLLQLHHPLSVDLYVEKTLCAARLIVVRLLGGRSYWSYGVEQLRRLALERGIGLVCLPGDDRPDPELARLSTLPNELLDALHGYFLHGGIENLGAALEFLASELGYDATPPSPRALPKAGLYCEPKGDGRPIAALVFYRAMVQSGDLALIDAIIAALDEAGLNCLAMHVAGLKDPDVQAVVEAALARHPVSIVLNLTGFAVTTPGAAASRTPFSATGRPVLQLIASGGSESAWAAGTTGLSPRDIAMSVALPEIDGRLLTRAVSFKGDPVTDAATEITLTRYRPVPDRVAFVARLSRAWVDLAKTPAAERRVAVLLANYPDRDGRLANGVGLDTPASTLAVLEALAQAGYQVTDAPPDTGALMAMLQAGPTNALADRATRRSTISLPVETYRRLLATIPAAARAEIDARWGPPEVDPHVVDGAFRLSLHSLGRVVLGIQPARGYHVDPNATYHSPDLVPPHGYLACYWWLRHIWGAQAVVHLGKHGNLEWLPGKALALSAACWPEIALGPIPHLYPFIVNDPGEGSQAKRRAQAVIIDHLTPPLTRAEHYGELAALEALVDEYASARELDPRRLAPLRQQILELSARLGLDRDLGLDPRDEASLTTLDNHLCELKELQIRDGLHILGSAPTGSRRTDLLVALTRLKRGRGEGADASLITALARDLGIGPDPMTVEPTAAAGTVPPLLGRCRHMGDVRAALEDIARSLVGGDLPPGPNWQATSAVLGFIQTELAARLESGATAELSALLAGLDGRFVEPGPSGAPTRGRLDVLPTGRNFYSVDTRAVPTPTAWTLGWRSAETLIEQHRQEHGDWPRRIALSAWGTANMRTGGDDIAQALAFLGCRPLWEPASGRVTGIELLPLDVLGRPRIDVTMRVSGFFRDAFPEQMALFDDAVRAVAEADEPAAMNPLGEAFRRDRDRLVAEGVDGAAARRQASYRLFGSKPGAYGAGLQALIDSGGWVDESELAESYIAWSSWAYGRGVDGQAASGELRDRLHAIEVVLHNQDNREHDILDSDDYYQFQGGLTVAVRHLAGRRPIVLHADHANPERLRIRGLKEEIGRVVRGRAANPKWLNGVMRHGYKGAFEIAATVDYLFAYAATTRLVEDHHFEALFDAYLGDEQVRDFMTENNPAALRETADRFAEAVERGLWQPRRNSAQAIIEGLRMAPSGDAAD
jgi:cobaltochelatase CobN